MRLAHKALWPAAATVGIAAEWVQYGSGDTRSAVPDLLTGWALIACGLIGRSRRPASRSGSLLAATGFAWFLGNLVGAEAAWVAWVGAHGVYLYRGPLVHVALTYPGGRATGRLDRAAVAAGYTAAFVLAVWRSPWAAIGLSVALVAVALALFVLAARAMQRERLASLLATCFLALVFGGCSALRLAFPTAAMADATVHLTELGLVVLAAGMLAGLLEEPWRRPRLTDLVVELGEGGGGPLRLALAGALGDPTVRIGTWDDEHNGYVDEEGLPFEVTPSGVDQVVTRIEVEGRPAAVIAHDPSLVQEAAVVDAIAAASALATTNSRLNADVRRTLEEIVASRRRLLLAADTERRELERRLHIGAEQRLARLGALLEDARQNGVPGTTVDDRIAAASDQLERTVADLAALGRGLHPGVLEDEGLAGALARLATESALRVELAASVERLPVEIEVAAYFVCSEALANASKHARAEYVSMSVRTTSRTVEVRVRDDGSGGADPSRGSGLRGLADRVEALGGTLQVDSVAGAGTDVRAELPLAPR